MGKHGKAKAQGAKRQKTTTDEATSVEESLNEMQFSESKSTIGSESRPWSAVMWEQANGEISKLRDHLTEVKTTVSHITGKYEKIEQESARLAAECKRELIKEANSEIATTVKNEIAGCLSGMKNAITAEVMRVERKVNKIDDQVQAMLVTVDRLTNATALSEEEVKYFRFMRSQCEKMGSGDAINTKPAASNSTVMDHQAEYVNNGAVCDQSSGKKQHQNAPQLAGISSVPSPIRSV